MLQRRHADLVNRLRSTRASVDALNNQFEREKEPYGQRSSDDPRDAAASVPGAWQGSVPHPSRLPYRPDVNTRTSSQQDRIWHVDTRAPAARRTMPGDMTADMEHDPEQAMKDMRTKALTAASLGRSFLF